MKWLKLCCAVLVCAISAGLWWAHFLRSPLMNPEQKVQRQYVNTIYEQLAPDLQEQRLLARDYWLRYPDIKNDSFWGEKSRMGIKGPADHYRHHGKREGRIYARVIRPDNQVLEKKLAQAYWERNPDVAKSSIWGKDGTLGILGPRDHYRFYGKRQGRKWGE